MKININVNNKLFSDIDVYQKNALWTINQQIDMVNILLKNPLLFYLLPQIFDWISKCDSKESKEHEYNKIDIKLQKNTSLFSKTCLDKEIQKIKGLIASTKAELTKQGEILEELNISKDATIYGDSIKFARGHKIAFNEKDTSKNLQWKSSIIIDSVIKFNFDYDYKFEIQTDFIRNKDKSIKVQYTINDKDLLMKKNHSFIIPSVQRTKWEMFIDKNKRWLYPVGAGILVGAGGYAGYKIAK